MNRPMLGEKTYKELNFGNKTDYYWVLLADGRMKSCYQCRSEVPISEFETYGCMKALCKLCANTPNDQRTPVIAALNTALVMMGVFDDVRVISEDT